MTALSPLESARRGARQSRFVKKALDAYDTTDPRAVAALRPHITGLTRFVEPCAGKGDLVAQLQAIGLECLDAFDIAPRADGIRQQDALEPLGFDVWNETIITNPPFGWPLVHDLINHWCDQRLASWLLLEANFAHTIRAAPLMRRCRKIVSIGRLKWVEGSAHGSTKDYAWYEFRASATTGQPALFYPRQITGKAA